jgi:hypothetical protein
MRPPDRGRESGRVRVRQPSTRFWSFVEMLKRVTACRLSSQRLNGDKASKKSRVERERERVMKTLLIGTSYCYVVVQHPRGKRQLFMYKDGREPTSSPGLAAS